MVSDHKQQMQQGSGVLLERQTTVRKAASMGSCACAINARWHLSNMTHYNVGTRNVLAVHVGIQGSLLGKFLSAHFAHKRPSTQHRHGISSALRSSV
jgi:hypothetical protein